MAKKETFEASVFQVKWVPAKTGRHLQEREVVCLMGEEGFCNITVGPQIDAQQRVEMNAGIIYPEGYVDFQIGDKVIILKKQSWTRLWKPQYSIKLSEAEESSVPDLAVDCLIQIAPL